MQQRSEKQSRELGSGGSGVVPTWQVAAQHLHPHADTSRRPPLGENSDVLRHDLLKAPHLRRVVVAVSFKDLRGRSRRESGDNVTSQRAGPCTLTLTFLISVELTDKQDIGIN